MSRDPDVIVVGAGIAGLAAACELGRAGLSVRILEARNRIGGRIFSAHDAMCNTEIPLGAEFIHGKPDDIWTPLQKAGVEITEVEGDYRCHWRGQLCGCDFFSEVESILDKMDESMPDESFLAFLERCCPNPTNDPAREETRQHAIGFVSGFNAADPARVGVHWLVQGMRAEERVDGDRAFRAKGGYGKLVELFQQQAAAQGVAIQTGSVVQRIRWESGQTEVAVTNAAGDSLLTGRRVLVTVPLSLLQTGAIEFIPPLPQAKMDALDKLEMGHVLRISLTFRERFWDNLLPSTESKKTLSDMAFLFSQDQLFPTWWTTMPERLPIITGWAPSRSAQCLFGEDRPTIIHNSLQTLGELLSVKPQQLESLLQAAYFYDWQNDPFSQGAYSYGKVGADGGQQALAAPLEETLFFAGEATDISGNNGTVHGAIASGYRAAEEILRTAAK